MDKIYVTGHRNPDTDSIVAAIAYAVMHNAMGDQEYVAARLGHLSDETKAILKRFGFEPPVFITDVRTQVQDLEYDVPPSLIMPSPSTMSGPPCRPAGAPPSPSPTISAVCWA